MSDDLATVHYRTKGGQKAPLIIRTRGHRLEGSGIQVLQWREFLTFQKEFWYWFQET
jgi:hypothetical protein